MKYKTLKSLAHNFTHSFVKNMDYLDERHVIDDLKQIVRKIDGEKICIFWIPDKEQDIRLTPRVRKRIDAFKKFLPSMAFSMQSDVSAIREFRTDIYLKPNKQIAVESYLMDIRGQVYVAPVYDF